MLRVVFIRGSTILTFHFRAQQQGRISQATTFTTEGLDEREERLRPEGTFRSQDGKRTTYQNVSCKPSLPVRVLRVPVERKPTVATGGFAGRECEVICPAFVQISRGGRRS